MARPGSARMVTGPPPPPIGPVRAPGQASRGPASQHTLQCWVPCLAYELFGSQQCFEALVAAAKQDGVNLGRLDSGVVAACRNLQQLQRQQWRRQQQQQQQQEQEP
ncbi:MAG: hypothetical protein GY772_22660 [bacterium]|nr:hypothetical protein [bacterium]